AVEAAGARVVPLPPYSPDLTPIEEMVSKVKGAMRPAVARATEAVYAALASALHDVTLEGYRWMVPTPSGVCNATVRHSSPPLTVGPGHTRQPLPRNEGTASLSGRGARSSGRSVHEQSPDLRAIARGDARPSSTDPLWVIDQLPLASHAAPITSL